MAERGEIRNPDRKQQINDFSGLKYGSITPTDLDGVIEYKDKAYIFFEVKYMCAEVKYGQRTAIERLVKDTGKNGKRSIAMIIDHEVADTAKSVPVAECIVREIYLSEERRWRKTKKKMKARECIDSFLEWI